MNIFLALILAAPTTIAFVIAGTGQVLSEMRGAAKSNL